jgi:hypothetical protein
MQGIISKSFYDIQGRKYIDIDSLKIKVPFRYGRVSGCTVGGHIPVQDYPVGSRVEYALKRVSWNGLEYLVLQNICLLDMGKQPNPTLNSNDS